MGGALINIHEGRGLPPAGAPGRILKSSRGHWGSWEAGPQRRSGSEPDLSSRPESLEEIFLKKL